MDPIFYRLYFAVVIITRCFLDNLDELCMQFVDYIEYA